MDIREHGICVEKSRVQCIYCNKEMSCFGRLKYHLGGVRGEGTTICEQVPYTIRETFRTMVTKKRSEVTASRVGEVQMSNGHKRGRSEDSSDKHDWLSKFSALDSPSFREMMTVCGGQMQLKIPDIHDLNGKMLQEALKIVQDHVKKIKAMWEITGCSILLEAWVDQKGRDMVSFVADCPAGPVYLRSYDVSDMKTDVTALTSLVDGVVDEVGVRNVVQILACSTSGWVGELGKFFAANRRVVFWSVCVSHCIELMLVNLWKMDFFEDILDKVNNIWEFINNNPSVFEILGDDIDMTVSSSEFEFLTPYLTLVTIFKVKNNLVAMFASYDWNKEEYTSISKLVNDSSFWETAERVMKCTYPLLCGLLLFSTANNQHTGYIYDAMDDIKESIAKEFDNDKSYYKRFWDVIDVVWETHLHSPLHAAGYFLNPTFVYSTDFHLDQEVATGLISSLVHMVKDCDIQAKIATQLDTYRLGKDCFYEASQADQIFGISPAEWWAQKARQVPELQSLAIKILSQTCQGASRYKLKRSFTEKLLITKGLSPCEQQHLEELAFIHYNLHLQNCTSEATTEEH